MLKIYHNHYKQHDKIIKYFDKQMLFDVYACMSTDTVTE